MKKNTTAFFLLLFFAIGFTHCGSKSKASSQSLTGKWVLGVNKESYMLFNADGTGEEQSIQGLEQFEWRKEGNNLCIVKLYQIDEESAPVKSEESCGEFEISGNELSWKVLGMTIELIKE